VSAGALLATGAVAYGVLAALAEPAPRHPFFDAARTPEVIAHRGGAALRPENTLAAFLHAVEVGADILEMDLRVTADREIVVMHDATVERTTDGRGAVAALTLAELRKLDAGYRWTPDGGASFPYRGRGIRAPALEEVFRRLPNARMNLEMKQFDAAQARALYEKARPAYEAAFARHKQKLLFTTPWPPSGLWTKVAASTPEAVARLRIRTYDKTGTEVMAKVAASATIVSFSELPAKLASGDIDAALTLAERVLAVEEWSEPAHRLVIAAHLARPDKGSARRALDQYHKMLSELGARPDEAALVLERLLET